MYTQKTRFHPLRCWHTPKPPYRHMHTELCKCPCVYRHINSLANVHSDARHTHPEIHKHTSSSAHKSERYTHISTDNADPNTLKKYKHIHRHTDAQTCALTCQHIHTLACALTRTHTRTHDDLQMHFFTHAAFQSKCTSNIWMHRHIYICQHKHIDAYMDLIMLQTETQMYTCTDIETHADLYIWKQRLNHM